MPSKHVPRPPLAARSGVNANALHLLLLFLPGAELELENVKKKLSDARSEYSKEERKLRDLQVGASVCGCPVRPFCLEFGQAR